ncbi:MAG: hypothetical protein ACJ762_09705 [Solirubrobacteraceae bacterium]
MMRAALRGRRGLLGLVVIGASLLLCAWSIYHLMRSGSCASGGVYVIASPCPSEMGGYVLGLLGSIALGVAGPFVARSAIAGVAWFGLFFTVIGASAILTAVGPASLPDSEGGGLVMGIVFIAIMGLPVVALAFYSAGKGVDSG